MKKSLRWISCVLACVFILSTTVFASESPNASAYITGTSASIVAGSNGNLTIYFSVGSPDIMTELGATMIYLYENNGKTTTVAKIFRCTDDGYSYFMAQDAVFHGDNVTYKGTVGYQYYATVYLMARDNTGSDTIAHTTRTVTAKK